MRYHGKPIWALVYLLLAGGLRKNGPTPDINIKLRISSKVPLNSVKLGRHGEREEEGEKGKIPLQLYVNFSRNDLAVKTVLLCFTKAFPAVV